METISKIQRRQKPVTTTHSKNKNSGETVYHLIVNEAIVLLKNFNSIEKRTYCLIDHTKSEQNTNLMQEFICYFWNISLQIGPHKETGSIQIDIGKEGLVACGGTESACLLFRTLQILHLCGLSPERNNILFINNRPLQLLYYYNSIIARGETESVSIESV